MHPVPALKILLLFLAVAITASAAQAFNCCRAADVTDDGWVNTADLAEIDACMGLIDPRKDLDGSGVVDEGDRNRIQSFVDNFGNLDCSTYCRADLDGDGAVGDADLAIVLEVLTGQICGDLLECEPGEPVCARSACLAADFNKDGRVDTNDQWFLRAEWGACPGLPMHAFIRGDAPNPCAEDPDTPESSGSSSQSPGSL